jgi:hypothetical protein
MKSTALIFLLLLLTCYSCKKTGTVPECLQSHIDHLADFSCDHGANVKKYKFQGMNVYVFSMGHCGADLSESVLDENCNYLGSLGGMEGNTRINGVEFSTAKYIRTIWSR